MPTYELFIPPAEPDGFNITATIEATSWVSALRTGLAKLGDTADVKNIMCDIRDDGIHVTEPASHRVFRIRELEGEGQGPVDAPPSAESAAASTPSATASPTPSPAAPAINPLAPPPGSTPVTPFSGAFATTPMGAIAPAAVPKKKSSFPSAQKFLEDLDSEPPHTSALTPPDDPEQAPAPQIAAPTPPTPPVPPVTPPPPASPEVSPQDSATTPPPPRVTAAAPPPPAVATHAAPPPAVHAPPPAAAPHSVESIGPTPAAAQSADGAVPIGRIGRIVEPPAEDLPPLEEVYNELMVDTQMLYDKGDVRRAANFLLELAMTTIPSDSGAVFISDINADDLYFAAAKGPKAAEVMGYRVPMGQGIVGFSAQEGVALAVSDVERDPRFYAEVSRALGYETKSIICAPAQQDGRVYGALELINRLHGSTFSERDVSILHFLANEFADYLINTGQTGR